MAERSKPKLAREFYERDFEWETARALRQSKWESLHVTPLSDADEGGVWEGLYVQRGKLIYRPRRYILQAFPLVASLLAERSPETRPRIFDLGCGAGATMVPLMDFAFDNVDFYASDISPHAVLLLREEFETRLHRGDASGSVTKEVVAWPSLIAFEWDLTQSPPPELFPAQLCDAGMLVFTLSAIRPELHRAVLENCRASLVPGKGLLFFRDYGAYDMVQERCERRVGEMTALKHDGVLCTFFALDLLRTLFLESGFSGFAVEPRFCTVRNVNRKEGSEMLRVFVTCVARA